MYSAGATENTRVGETSRKDGCVVGLASKKDRATVQSLKPLLDDHHKKEELESIGELSKVSSQIVSKCLYRARIGRPDILWSVNKLTRSVTQ